MELVERLPHNLNLTVVNRAHAKKAYADGVDVYVAITQDSFLRFNIERDTKKNALYELTYAASYYLETNNVVLVGCDKTLIKYLHNLGIEGLCIENATLSDIKGKIVYKFGVELPLYLVSQCKAYYDIQYKDIKNKKSGYNIKRYVIKEET